MLYAAAPLFQKSYKMTNPSKRKSCGTSFYYSCGVENLPRHTLAHRDLEEHREAAEKEKAFYIMMLTLSFKKIS